MAGGEGWTLGGPASFIIQEYQLLTSSSKPPLQLPGTQCRNTPMALYMLGGSESEWKQLILEKDAILSSSVSV